MPMLWASFLALRFGVVVKGGWECKIEIARGT